VAKVADEASKPGVAGPPTVFPDGRRLDGAELLPDGLAAAVAAAAAQMRRPRRPFGAPAGPAGGLVS
jgi:hypothetical protein